MMSCAASGPYGVPKHTYDCQPSVALGYRRRRNRECLPIRASNSLPTADARDKTIELRELDHPTRPEGRHAIVEPEQLKSARR